MNPRPVAGETVLGCDECGRTWLAEDALKRLVHAGYDALCEVDQVFLAEGPATTDDATPPCPDCGGPLQAHGVSHAPDLHLLDCAACHRVLLSHGQATALASHLPAPAPPPQAASAEALPPLPTFSKGQPVRPPGCSPWRWPERLVGCPWLAWFVFGMPFWAALLLVLLSGLLAAPPPNPTTHSYGHFLTDSLTLNPPTIAMSRVLFWPFHALLLILFLTCNRYGGPSLRYLNVLGTWLVMLRVVACYFTVWGLILRACLLLGLGALGMLVLGPVFLVAALLVGLYGVQNLAPN
jgi:hypothetical protein